MSDRSRLPDGRQVSVHRLGIPGGRLVVLCHATPGSGRFDPVPGTTERRGVEIVAVDRPGYGNSDTVAPDEWATVSGAADDLASVLRSSGIEQVGVAGWSAGGRVAMALAAGHPDLVDRLCVISTPAPQEAVPWIPAEHQAALDALAGLPPAQARAILGEQMAAMIPSDPFTPAALALIGADETADAGALAFDGARERLGGMLDVAFAHGAAGMASDLAGYTLRPWGFDPEAVRQKTLLIYGGRDPVIGSRHGRWWQSHLPNARLEMDPGVGHLAVISGWDRALAFLGSTRGR